MNQEINTAAPEEVIATTVVDEVADTQEASEETLDTPNNVIDLGAIMQQQNQIYFPVNPMVLVYNQKAITDIGYEEGINQNTNETQSQLNKSLDTDAFFCPLPVARHESFYQFCSCEIIVKRVEGKLRALSFIQHREEGDSLNVGVLGSVSIGTASTFDNGCVSINDTVRRTIMVGRQVALYVDPEKASENMNGDFFISEHVPGKVILVNKETDGVLDRKMIFINVLVVAPEMELEYSENIQSNPEVELLGYVDLDTLEAMGDVTDATARYTLALIREQEAEINQAADGLDAQIKAHKEANVQKEMDETAQPELPWEAPVDAANDTVVETPVAE